MNDGSGGEAPTPGTADGNESALRTQAMVAIAVSLAVAGGVAWAGSQGSTRVFGFPLFALFGAVAFAVNWIVYVPSYLKRTEHYYDLTGSLTYLTLVALGVAYGARDPRTLVLGLLVGIWAVRLGSFLFARVKRAGTDPRFDALKQDAVRFLMTWTLQGLWVFLTLSCALAAMSSVTVVPLGLNALIGAAVWVTGFAIEAVADRQKGKFRADPANRGQFISSGLWAWSRHPNYFGEIVLWIGVAIIALPTLSGWQHVTLISPVFVYVLLTRVSGIPLLESRADEKWGDDPAYLAYKARTPVLWLRPPTS